MNRLHHPRRLATAVLGCFLALHAAGTPAAAGDPTNKAQCLSSLRPAVAAQCRQAFSEADKQAACLKQVGPQVAQTCERFFGDAQSFCTTCTSSCAEAYGAGDSQRKECLAMCRNHSGCR